MDTEKKREYEKQTVSLMIRLYCKHNHRTKELCPECAELDSYARFRSNHCPFMENKTFCSNCKVHCYKPEMREKIRKHEKRFDIQRYEMGDKQVRLRCLF